MMSTYPPVQRCLCDGRYDGCTHGRRCDEPGGGGTSPYFCGDCDPRRIQHISKSLAEMKQHLEGRRS